MKRANFNSRSMMIFSLIAIVAVSSIFFVFPDGINAQETEKTFVTHSGGMSKDHR